jgi:phospholipid/cholesterol/gamma-HCH transport system ATP-binding protein
MIEIINLSKAYEGRPVLSGVNLKIREGETMVIMGRSGCGKSVLLKHIIGLVRPDAGQVFVDGQEISRLSGEALSQLRMKFGMLFQGAALFDSLSVGENVAFSLREHTTMTEKQIQDRVSECLNLVGLPNIEDRRPADLSGGMRKRVGLARAVAMQPKIVLYDEPTTGIDPVMSDVINRLIIRLRDQLKVTGIVVTHDLVSAYTVGNRIAMLHEGAIEQMGTVAEIRSSSNSVVRQFLEPSLSRPSDKGGIA